MEVIKENTESDDVYVVDDNQVLLNLDQIKQEADEAPLVVYENKEQWAFLFNEDETKMEPPKEEEDKEVSDELLCHWCSFTTNDPLNLIDHDYENHASYLQGKRVYKSYKCPSCDYTSVDPSLIRNHYETHRTPVEPIEPEANDTDTPTPPKEVQKKIKKKKKKRNIWWPTRKRGKLSEDERRLRKRLATRKYRASLPPEIVALRRVTQTARMRLKRSQETPEQVAERRQKQALRVRLKRAAETPEQVELRRTKQRNRARVRRALETDTQKEERKEKERLRARERRASMPMEQKEMKKLEDRTRKRYFRHQTKVNREFAHVSDFINSSENPYLQSSSVYYESLSQNNLDDVMRLYPLPIHMLIDTSLTENPKSGIKKGNKKQISKRKTCVNNKKTKGRGRPKKNKKAVKPKNVKGTKNNTLESSDPLINEKIACGSEHNSVENATPENNDSQLIEMKETCNNDLKSQNEVENTIKPNGMIQNGLGLQPDQINEEDSQKDEVENGYDANASSEEFNKFVPFFGIKEDDGNRMRQYQLSKLNKINKLLERMRGKEAK